MADAMVAQQVVREAPSVQAPPPPPPTAQGLDSVKVPGTGGGGADGAPGPVASAPVERKREPFVLWGAAGQSIETLTFCYEKREDEHEWLTEPELVKELDKVNEYEVDESLNKQVALRQLCATFRQASPDAIIVRVGGGDKVELDGERGVRVPHKLVEQKWVIKKPAASAPTPTSAAAPSAPVPAPVETPAPSAFPTPSPAAGGPAAGKVAPPASDACAKTPEAEKELVPSDAEVLSTLRQAITLAAQKAIETYRKSVSSGVKKAIVELVLPGVNRRLVVQALREVLSAQIKPLSPPPAGPGSSPSAAAAAAPAPDAMPVPSQGADAVLAAAPAPVWYGDIGGVAVITAESARDLVAYHAFMKKVFKLPTDPQQGRPLEWQAGGLKEMAGCTLL